VGEYTLRDTPYGVGGMRQITTKLPVGKDPDAGHAGELSGRFCYDRVLSGILTEESRGGTSSTGFVPASAPEDGEERPISRNENDGIRRESVLRMPFEGFSELSL